MQIEYEEKHDIMNIQFSDEEIAESIEYEGIIVDYSKDKKVVAIEILDVSKRIKASPFEKITFSLMREKAEV